MPCHARYRRGLTRIKRGLKNPDPDAPITPLPKPTGRQRISLLLMTPDQTPSERRRIKMMSRARAYGAIKRGKLQRSPCEVCGTIPAQAHHGDYSRPHDVQWLWKSSEKSTSGRAYERDDLANVIALFAAIRMDQVAKEPQP